MRIAIGSTNPVKINAVTHVARQYWPACEIVPYDVPTGVSEQPRNDIETITGARNRARAVLDATLADIGLGLEGGIEDMEYGMFVTNWAVAIGKDGTIGYGSSAKMELPESIAMQLRAGRELGPVMDEFTQRTKSNHANGAIGTFTRDVVRRQDSFEHAVAYALVRFVNKGLY